MKSALIRTVLDGEMSGADRSEKAAGRKAAAQLERLGWTAHLDKSRASRAAKAEAKATSKPKAADATEPAKDTVAA